VVAAVLSQPIRVQFGHYIRVVRCHSFQPHTATNLKIVSLPLEPGLLGLVLVIAHWPLHRSHCLDNQRLLDSKPPAPSPVICIEIGFTCCNPNCSTAGVLSSPGGLDHSQPGHQGRHCAIQNLSKAPSTPTGCPSVPHTVCEAHTKHPC
jgi:hypothetical protein